MSITLNSLWGRLLISILFSAFSEILSCSFYWNNLFFCPTLCVCFCVLVNWLPLATLNEWPYIDVCGAQKCSPTWSPEPGTQGMSPMWVSCILLLCQGCGYTWALQGWVSVLCSFRVFLDYYPFVFKARTLRVFSLLCRIRVRVPGVELRSLTPQEK